ncbi:MAG TPA: branched-chain amino acid ABC transporter permease [Alphaproteobacteria bacterium]|nr:branched-chain amino acid ABC transporter permease [Alphaproteobacteria bacterium]
MEPLPLIVDGMALGAIYALASLAFVLILNGVGAVNLAHGDLVTLGGFVAIAIAAWAPAWPGLMFLPAVALIMAVGGFLLVAVIPRRPRRDAPDDVAISTFAIGAVLAAFLAATLGPEPVHGPPLLGRGTIDLFGIGLSRQSLVVILAAALLVPAVHVLLNSTQFGRRLRAAGQDPELARALGIHTGRFAAMTFGLGTMMAGIAGMLLADRFQISAGYGLDLLVKSYIAVAIAGWGRAGPAALVALLIALFQTAVSVIAPPVVADAVVYAALLALLVVQPQGLFGPAAQRRA